MWTRFAGLGWACVWLGGLGPLAAAPVGVFEDSRDIGNPPAPGSTTLNGGTYTLKGSGADIWDTGDQFHFAYRKLRGDFSMTMRVTRRDKLPAGSNQWGRHGIMARWSLDADAKHSLVATLLPTVDGPGSGSWQQPIHQFRMFHRDAATTRVNYRIEDETFPDEGRLPTWMRLLRVGNAIYSYLAEDADHDGLPDRWILVGSDSAPSMPPELLVGAFLCPQASILGTMSFDNVSIVDGLKSPPMECSIGQTLISQTYDVTDPNAMADAVSIQCTNLGAPGPNVFRPGRLRLTADLQNLGTAVWYDLPTSYLMTQQGFIAEFDVFMGPAGKPDPADGMTFAAIERGADILAPAGVPDLCGEASFDLGYGRGRIRDRADGHPSFAVEIDNWTIGGEPGNDPPSGGGQAGLGRYHVGLDVNGEVSSVQTNEDLGVPSQILPDLFQAEGVHFWVQYFPDGEIDVYATSNKPPYASYQVLSHHIPPLSGPLLVGFTGGTGLAAAIRDVDNFTIRLTGCSAQPPSALQPRLIDLGHITGGGDGIVTNPAPHLGVDPRTGRFTDAYIPGPFNDFDPPGDHVNPSEGEGSFIDCAFFVTNRQSGEFIFPQNITMSGVKYRFPDYDVNLQSYGGILRDRNGGAVNPGINVGGITHFTTGVGIHSATGITYDLDAIRAVHGWRNVRCFSTTWGLNSCAGGEVDLFLIFSTDAGVQLDKLSHFVTNGGETFSTPIPASARYLTLATGGYGADSTCDQGVFARAVIGPLECSSSTGAWIWDVTPKLVSTLGGQAVTFLGEAMPAIGQYRIGGKNLTSMRPIPPMSRQGDSPQLSEGFHDAEIFSLGGEVALLARLPNAIEAAPPVELTSVDPDAIVPNVPTLVTIRGKSFRQGVTRFELVGQNVTLDLGGGVMSPTEAIYVLPPGALPPGEPNGPKSVRAVDPRGNFTLPDAIRFLDTSAIALTGVSPGQVSTSGGATITFTGNGFVSGSMKPRLGGKELTGVTFSGSTQIRGSAPALAAGFHTAQIMLDTGEIVASRTNAVEAIAPVVLSSITPNVVLRDGTTRVVARGQGFRTETRIRIGGRDLVGPALAADKLSISGIAPALLSGEPLGARDATATNPLDSSTLRNAVTYTAPPSSAVPGPQEMEGALAEGMARFRWVNPIAYDEIIVKDPSDRVVSRIAGNATLFEVPAGDQSEVRFSFQGVDRARGTGISEGLAHAYQCSRPPPLQGNPVVGEMGFSVYGGSVPSTVTGRCGGGGGGSTLEQAVEDAARGRGAGSPQAVGSVGYVETNRDAVASGRVSLTNVLTTGFTLAQPADKLEIRAHYEKLIAEFGVSLRARIVHVGSGDGFVDEVTFPEVLINKGKDWNGITYYRADRDAGDVGAAACNLKIPQGDYLLDIYCVGGSSSLPYFVFSDDGRDKPLLVPGSPCPPYPLVTVKDLTGYATLPDITVIEAEHTGPAPGGKKFVRLKAKGQWLDEEGKSHPIDPEDARPGFEYVQADHEYTFKVFEAEHAASQTSSTNEATVSLGDFGCFEVEVTAMDRACAFSKTRTLEVAIIPSDFGGIDLTRGFLYPTPDPASVVGVVGLDPPPGPGHFSGRRPLSFRVLAVPKPCAGPVEDCTSLTEQQLQFRFAYKQDGVPVAYYNFPAANIADLCGDITTGPKYFLVSLDDPRNPDDDSANDVGRLPGLSGAGTTFVDVYLQGKRSIDAGFVDIGSPMHLTNSPPILERTFWTGSYDRQTDVYYFASSTSSAPASSFDVGPSREVDLPLEGADAKVPSFDNGMNSGLIARFKLEEGAWQSGEATGTTSGQMLGNRVDGAPMRFAPEDAGDGAGGAANQYEWCKAQTLVENTLKQTLFDAILFTGAIGPIPVTIYAKIALAMDIKVEALARVFLAPLAAFDGGTFFESDFYLLSKLQISIPCSIRADILFGIANVSATLRPQVRTNLDLHLGARNLSLEKGLDVGAYMDLFFDLKACLDLLVTSICYEDSTAIFNNEEILHAPIGDVPFCVKDNVRACTKHTPYCTPPVARPGGAGGGGVPTQVYIESNAPVTVSSPDGETTIDSWIDAKGEARVFVNANPMDPPDDQGDLLLGRLRDPVAAFISNTRAIVVYGASFTQEANLPAVLPSDPTRPEYYPPRNKIAAQTEILMWSAEAGATNWNWRGEPSRVADPVLEIPDPAARRADGRAAIAADVATQQALVAWVRYDTPDFLVQEPGQTTRIWLPQPGGTFQVKDAPTVRPQLRKTAIYSRRVGFTGLVGSRNMLRKVSAAADGINIEPSIACSPGGAAAYCVWVNDPVNRDLVTSNQDRHLLFSVYNRSNDVDAPGSRPWSAPADVILDTSAYPGLLEPAIQLSGDRDGLLAFTALDPAETTPLDSGLTGGTRYVYTCRLQNGVFAPPVRIHGECLARIYGHWPIIKKPLDVEAFDPVARLRRRLPDWVGIFQGKGELGSLAGSGDVKIVAMGKDQTEFGPPITYNPGTHVRTNVGATATSTGIHTVSLTQGFAQPIFGLGVGGGLDPVAGAYETFDVALRPDLAIQSVDLSDAFSAPGAAVVARVQIKNLGLSGSPYDGAGRTAVGIQAVFIDDGGEERIVAAEPVSELQPGASQPLELTIEMPFEPVKLRVELHPNPLDTDTVNDSKELFFGAPSPGEVHCSEVTVAASGATATRISWESPALYDEVRIYRDGATLAVLPPSSRSFLDQRAAPGAHAYAVQGVIGASKSRRVACVAVEAVEFLRGDTDSSGSLDISDGISTLNYLFTGGRTPDCLKAADSDDSGQVDISDAILTLGYLFLGKRAPSPPHPACGIDPTADGLECEAQPKCR